MSNQDNEKNKRLHETIGALETGDAIPAAPSPGANAEEVAAGYFDPNDIRERWAQLYNHCTFTHDPHGTPTRYVTVETGIFDEFAHDFAALLESFRAETLERAKQAAHEVYVKWPTQSLGGMDERIGMALGNLQADPNWLARQLDEARAETLAAKELEIDALTNELRYLRKLANGLANEVIEGTEPHHKRETAFQVVAATKSQLTEGK